MPVQPTYPGIYLEELPSNDRTITAAPTSITVFVGYTHPFKTKKFNEAVRIFDFTEYQREFGGFYLSEIFDQTVTYAVNQFFLNGGSDAYVVGLKAKYKAVAESDPLKQPSLPSNISGIVFTPLEPTDQMPIKVTINNLNASGDTGDITIIYNTQVETFRGVKVTGSIKDEAFIDNRINGVSALVTVKPGTTNYTTLTAKNEEKVTNFPAGVTNTFDSADFTKVFQDDSSLDKVSIFNLLAIPGLGADSNAIWSAALAFCERKEAFRSEERRVGKEC